MCIVRVDIGRPDGGNKRRRAEKIEGNLVRVVCSLNAVTSYLFYLFFPPVHTGSKTSSRDTLRRLSDALCHVKGALECTEGSSFLYGFCVFLAAETKKHGDCTSNKFYSLISFFFFFIQAEKNNCFR